VPIPTIKFYLREGLLPPGELTAPNQADYGDEHVHRLRLVRVMLEVGRLPLAAVRDVLAAVADEAVPLHDLLAVAHRALALRTVSDAPPDATAVREIDLLLRDLDWEVASESPARREVAVALAALRRLGWKVDAETLRPYALAADALAGREVEYVGATASRAESVERLVVGTVVFESVLAAFRRLAEERHSALRYTRAAGNLH
jgi:DNA-binding transcriptional MerR regulator